MEVAGHDFLPRFYFGAKGLEQVMLTMVDARNPAEANAAFDSLTVALRVRYGREISSKSTALVRTVDFLSGETNVSMVEVMTEKPILNIVYQHRLTQDAGKL